MGILDYLKRKNENVDVEDKKEEKVVEQPFIPNFSLLELEKMDWAYFGVRLKREGLLPPSYDREPVNKAFILDKDNNPIVKLLFKSKTSDSERELTLFKDKVRQIVNGKMISSINDKEILDVWKRFQIQNRYSIEDSHRHEINSHITRGIALKMEADQLLKFDNFFEREKEFLKQHKDEVYKTFYVGNNGIPRFIVAEDENSKDNQKTPKEVHPFSPKTLEHCVAKLTQEGKIWEAEDLSAFEEKCKIIADWSCYRTDDWQREIVTLKDMIRPYLLIKEVDNTLIQF